MIRYLESFRQIKRKNGRLYRRFRSSMGRSYWVLMDEREIFERELYWVVVVLTPLLGILAFAWAAGMI